MGLFGHKLAAAALALGIATAAVACSSGSGGKKVSQGATGHGAVTSSPGGTTTSTSPGAGTATSAPVPGVSGPGAPTTLRGGGATVTTRASATTPATKGNGAPPAATGPAPALPGAYYYNLVNGSSVLTTGTTTTNLTVPPQNTVVITSTGGGVQQWVTNSSATTTLAFTSGGVFLLGETLPPYGTCTFNAPVASPPWPLAVGKTFSGVATCGSGQNAATVTLQGRIGGATTTPVGGTRVATYAIQSILNVTGTSLTITETDLYAPSVRLPVMSNVVATGGASGYSINSNTTYALSSLVPA